MYKITHLASLSLISLSLLTLTNAHSMTGPSLGQVALQFAREQNASNSMEKKEYYRKMINGDPRYQGPDVVKTIFAEYLGHMADPEKPSQFRQEFASAAMKIGSALIVEGHLTIEWSKRLQERAPLLFPDRSSSIIVKAEAEKARTLLLALVSAEEI